MAKTPRVFPIVGGRKVEHLKDNIQALSIKLSNEQIERLEKASPFAPGFPQNVSLPAPSMPGFQANQSQFVGEDPGIVGTAQGGPLLKNAAPQAYVQRERAIGRE